MAQSSGTEGERSPERTAALGDNDAQLLQQQPQQHPLVEPPIPHLVPHGFVTHVDLVEPDTPSDDDAPMSPDPKRKNDWDDQIESFQSIMAQVNMFKDQACSSLKLCNE